MNIMKKLTLIGTPKFLFPHAIVMEHKNMFIVGVWKPGGELGRMPMRNVLYVTHITS